MLLRQVSIRFALLLAAIAFAGKPLLAQEVPEVLSEDQCVVCHVDFEVLPEDFLSDDVHMQPELSCAGCHGGDPTLDDEELAKAPGTGFTGVPAAADVPASCGSCHSDISFMRQFRPQIRTDQQSQYGQSEHGKKLQAGATDVAQCASCHSAHGILPATDTRSTVFPTTVPTLCDSCHGDVDRMAGTGLRTNQYAEYRKSIHAEALLDRHDTGSPACNDCHGNHGATPPGITSISHVCGSCHVNNMNYFAETQMARAFDEEGLHLCEECHGNHAVLKATDEMVGTDDSSMCTTCHEDGDAGYEAAAGIRAHLTELIAAHEAADEKRREVRRVGMDDIEIEYAMREVQQSLIRARTIVHTFDADEVGEVTSEGVASAQEALSIAQAELDDYRVRRLGFGVATFFITVLAIALFFKIRDMERVQASTNVDTSQQM